VHITCIWGILMLYSRDIGVICLESYTMLWNQKGLMWLFSGIMLGIVCIMLGLEI